MTLFQRIRTRTYNSLFQHFFSAVRSKGGFNDHPTVRQAAGAVRILASNAFLLLGFSKYANVEEEGEDSQASLLTDLPPLRERLGTSLLKEESEVEPVLAAITEAEDTDEAMLKDVEGLTERDTLAYVAGAILHRLGCAECNRKMLSDVELSSGSFIRQMTYSASCHMLQPTDSTLLAFASRLKPIITFYEKSFFVRILSELL